MSSDLNTPGIESVTDGNNESRSRGMHQERDGTWTALAYCHGTNLKTEGGAKRWLAKFRINPNGSRFAA